MSKEESTQQNIKDGTVYLGSVEFEQRWSGGECQYDSVKASVNIAINLPTADALAAMLDPAKLEQIIVQYQKLAKTAVHRSAIPVLEGMGRLRPQVTEIFAGLENADSSTVHRGTTGISRRDVDRLAGEMNKLAEQLRAKAEVTVTTGADDDSMEDDDAPVS